MIPHISIEATLLALIGLVSVVMSDYSTLIIAVVVAGAAQFGPLLLARQLNRARAVEKIIDWKRQDDVAEQARRAAEFLKEATKIAAENSIATINKLEVIHTLVNSQMTAAIQSELDATTRELAMMKEVIALNEAAGRKPSEEATGALVSTQDKITELRATLDERLRQGKVAEAQIKQAAKNDVQKVEIVQPDEKPVPIKVPQSKTTETP